MAITRIRDNFLDLQVQAQSGLQGEWDTRLTELAKIEAIFPEPSTQALGAMISKFWNAWQDVASDPTSTAARSTLVEQASSPGDGAEPRRHPAPHDGRRHRRSGDQPDPADQQPGTGRSPR